MHNLVKMKNNKHKILVLSDLTDQSTNVLKSASKIAQVIDGKIELFHVRKPTDLVEKESNLSAVRGLKDHYVLADKKLKALCETISEKTQVSIKHSFSFGNLKNEIEAHILKTKPDFIVLGKRVSKTPGFLGDRIFSFILKKFEGPVLLASNDAVLENESTLSLGLYNETTIQSNISSLNAIISNTEGPIRSFSIRDKPTETIEEQKLTSDGIVSYIFEKNGQTLKNMSNYMQKNKVNLLLVDRKSKNSSTKKDLSISALNDLALTIKVPLLFSH